MFTYSVGPVDAELVLERWITNLFQAQMTVITQEQEEG
jgi:hypothetical protein